MRLLWIIPYSCLAQVPAVLDGSLDDPSWSGVARHRLAPTEVGVPESLGGDVAVRACGGYLCVGARLPEPGGRVLARSIGRNPVWESDLLESPEVEDRIRIELAGERTAGRSAWVEINPWGAHRSEGLAEVLPAARIDSVGWTVEAALRTEFAAPNVRITRIRSRRALSPEFKWAVVVPAPGNGGAPPQFRPEPVGNTESALEVGRVSRLPRIDAEADDPAWSGAAEFVLSRNEPFPRAPLYATKVKLAHDGNKLALLFHASEPEPVVARAGGRDSNVTADDHVAVYLATTGSAFLEIAINTVGALRDARGRGPRIMRPDAGWNAAIEKHADIRHGYWMARLDIPLAACATALGEKDAPRNWRILITRLRAARAGEPSEQSSLPVLAGASTFYGPARYRAMTLGDGRAAPFASLPKPQGLAALVPNAWTPFERRARSVRSMLSRFLDRRAQQAVLAERTAWEQVRTREDWERFRDHRVSALRDSLGVFPPERPPLASMTTGRYQGRGYRLENVVFQGRKDSWITANLYLPERVTGTVPAIVIVHSQHFPKTQGELHDMGELWARSGCMVLVIERPGYGERVDTTPWYRQAYASRHTFTKQLFLVGESYSGWAAWDIIRSVDFLYSRPETNREKVILLGSVAGGGEPAGVAAALDPRIAAVAPFNYDQGHVRVHGDSPAQIARQFSPWLVAASVAPRRFIRAFEFGWEGAEEPDFANLWVDGMERSRRVWGFYGAADNLATSKGYGLIRLSMERASHCFSIGPQQREDLYPLLNRWFGIPFPEAADRAILPDSALSVSPERDQARVEEARRRRPHAQLVSITPAINAQMRRRTMNQIARAMVGGRSTDLRRALGPLLGDIEPTPSPAMTIHWSRTLAGAEVEAVSLAVEDGIAVPLFVIRPAGRAAAPAVVAVAQGGKARFLANRAQEIEKLLHAGIAVVLADVRGTGETAASPDGTPLSAAQIEFDLGRNLLGSRLKDLRTVLGWLRTRSDIDRARIGVWGDSFSPPNPANLAVDEIEFEVAPQIQVKADPLGAHLALLAGLYEDGIKAVIARGGLASYASVLDDPFTYVPMDVIIHGILKHGDLDDIEAAIRRPVLRDRRVNGRNIAVAGGEGASVVDWLVARFGE